MVPGCMYAAKEPIYISTLQSLESSSLEVLICLDCGHVELWALELEKLARQDISAKDLDRVGGKRT